MLFQPSNIYPSTFSGIGAGTVDVTQGINVSWQVNGDTPMTAYQIKIYQNDSGSTLMYDSGSVSVSPVFEPHDKNGNATYFTAIISAAALSTAGIVNGYQYGYKMLITQWWGVSDYVEQTSASVFITRSTPTLAINTITTPVASNSLTITANYSQAQGDPISTVEWVFALAGSESTPIRETGAISTQVLSFDADGLITGNTYSIMCKVVTSTGMEASTGFVQFPVSYSSSSLGINYQLAQLKNSSAVYLSWDDLGSNKLAYPYTDTTKTTNGITFTVNGEGDVVATGTATADAYFAIAQGTLSQLGITAGQKFIVTSGYSGAKIVVTETNSSNVVVSTITGNDPLQYIATSTTNTLKFSIVIPSGSVLSSGQQLQPMIAIEDKIVALNDVSVTMQPIQDLHGYDHPWPAGGGKNKIDQSKTYQKGANQLVLGQETAYSTRSIFLTAGTYTISVALSGGKTASIYLATDSDTGGRGIGDTDAARSFTLESDSHVAIWLYTSNGITASDLVSVQLESGSSATAWTPYSNICPISGRTGLNVYRTGKNLLSYTPTWLNYSALNVVLDKTRATFLKGNMQYMFSFDMENATSWRVAAVVFDENGNRLFDSNTYYLGSSLNPNGSGQYYVWSSNKSDKQTAITPIQDCYVMLFFNLGDVSASTVMTNPMLEIGSTTSSYALYNGNTYAVDWTSEAGTVYGGTLDVVTGVLTVNAMLEVFNVSDTNTISSQINGFNRTSGTVGTTGDYTRIAFAVRPDVDQTQYNRISSSYNYKISNMLKHYFAYNDPSAHWYRNTVLYAFFPTSLVGSTAQSVYDYLVSIKDTTPLSVWLELATPLTYQLTAQEIEALVGKNNVWSTGDSVSVTYTKDTGSQATLSGAIVTFSDSNAVLIPTPQYIPGITGISIYRYLQGESALQHVYDLAAGATSILDYYAPSQMQVSYLIVAHSGIGDLFLQTTKFTPTFWFFSILLCDTDSNGEYHVSKEYIFKYGVETGAVSNNNDPTIQKNFTPYPNRQPISTLYKTGKISGYIGKTNNLNRYSDSISLQNAIYDISVSSLDKFLKSRKGDVIKVDTASSIQMKTEDNTVQQALKATVDWVEVGEASQVSIVSVPSDSFWPIS